MRGAFCPFLRKGASMKMKLVMDQHGMPEVWILPCRLTDGRTKRFAAVESRRDRVKALEEVVEASAKWAFETAQKRAGASEPSGGTYKGIPVRCYESRRTT